MDRLSQKLRLVRSQSMGVGVGGVGMGSASAASGGEPKVMRRTPSQLEGRSACVVLLDERRLEVLVQPRIYAGELLDLVCAHCQLREKEYFGLAVVDDSGHYTWLQLDRKVLEHDLPRKPTTITIHFLVKFFIESIAHLSDNRTIELFYLQAKSLIFRGTLEVDSDIVFQLAALALQASHGDFVDDGTTRTLLKKCPVLPSSVLKEHSSMALCEEQVSDHYRKMRGQTRGQAIVNYMTIVESMPVYGVHFFEVCDKRQALCWLGLSCRGIAEYHHDNRITPSRVFPWVQLENLYFRDKKFSIEVHESQRVVQTLSSYNLYEDALKMEAASRKDDGLVDAIADSTTQVSTSRRALNPGSIRVYMWFGKTQGLTKCIWQSAISQHQFYLDRKQARMRHQQPPRTLKEIARNLTRSSASLSSASSLSNLSRSGSTLSLAISAGSVALGAPSTALASAAASASAVSPASATCASAAFQDEAASATPSVEMTEEAKRAKMEMIVALRARKEAIEAKLREKQNQLKELCIREGELTGELPPETPLAPGELPPQIRRRVGTEFTLSENALRKPQSPEEELLANLELEYEIQSKICAAAFKLANDVSTGKSVRKQRKSSYQQSQKKLREIETKLNALKYFGTKHKRKQPRPADDGDLDKLSKKGAYGREEIRRGKSVPDLDLSHSESPISFDEDDDDEPTLSPRSCPSSPRKNHGRGHDTVSLEPITPGLPSMMTGYIPSSVYLRSSYRSKQYPTLSTASSSSSSSLSRMAMHNTPLLATAAEMVLGADSSSFSSSPFRNKYEPSQLTQCDSPVGLYNCPQQRTSQAFSSLDDIDAMAAAASLGQQPMRTHFQNAKRQQQVQPPPSSQQSSHSQAHRHLFQTPLRLETAAAMANFPSLERSSRKQHHSSHGQAPPPTPHSRLNPSLAKRELPALPTSSSPSSRPKTVESARSMEDLDTLEAAGFRGSAKMSYREISSASANGVAAMDAMLAKLNFNAHHLRNTEEYPAHLSPAAPVAREHNMLGIRPTDAGGPYPSVVGHTSSTLLPGQTYPESSAKPLPAISSLQDVFTHYHQHQRSTSVITTSTVSSFTPSTSTLPSKKPKEVARNGSKDLEVDRADDPSGDERPPPLFPKQYHQVVEKRRRSGLEAPPASVPLRTVSESPAVNRRVKPSLPTPPPAATDPAAASSQHNMFMPFRESTKPFEMADFYKYSVKYRKSTSVGSLHAGSSEAAHANAASNGDNGSDSTPDSKRSSTASGGSATASSASQPPELPVRSPIKAPPAKPHHGREVTDVANDFSNEMLAWYNNASQKQKGPKSSSSSSNPPPVPPGKPATLV